jgi:hypothetical protein
MALHQPTLGRRSQDLVRVLLIVIAAVAVMFVATVVFGMPGSGPSLEIVPDPAGGLPF